MARWARRCCAVSAIEAAALDDIGGLSADHSLVVQVGESGPKAEDYMLSGFG